MAPKLKTITLGCKVNQYETEYVRQGLIGIGYENAALDEVADLCVVNTCTVTNEGDSKSRQMIRRLARDNPGARIVVMGCYATRAPQEVAALPGVAEVVTDKRELPDLLGRFGVVDIPTGISQFGTRHRAYLKVQDGCLLRCSYCIIPQVRPHAVSRPVAEILDEARRLLDNGYRELVLTGVHLGHYGVEQNRHKPKSQWLRLSHLVRQLAQLEGDFRIRLSSIEATEVTRELIDTMAEFSDKVCPHLHLCLQSGSDRILRRMRRRWSTRMFLDRCDLIRRSSDAARLDHRCDRRVSGRNGGRFSGDLPSGAGGRFLENPRVSVQRPSRNARGRHARSQCPRASKRSVVVGWRNWSRNCVVTIFGVLLGRTLRVLVESDVAADRRPPGRHILPLRARCARRKSAAVRAVNRLRAACVRRSALAGDAG